jgi:uncharacterized protein (TIGR03382 family)
LKNLLRLLPVVLMIPTLASASTVWKGDFETGNTSQWTKAQTVSSDRLLVVSDPVRQGRYALKATVRRGDDPIRSSGNRNELVYMTREAPGSEYFYKWSTRFPSSFPRSPRWQIFIQWHHEGSSGSPPLEFYVVNDELRLRAGGSSGPVVWRGPLVRERWHDFVLHVKWSSDRRVGFVELYMNGQRVLPKYHVATQFSGQRNYLKLGLYRDESIAPTGIVFHDGFTMATQLSDVMPPAVAQPVSEPTPVATPDTVPTEPVPTSTIDPPVSTPAEGPTLDGDPDDDRLDTTLEGESGSPESSTPVEPGAPEPVIGEPGLGEPPLDEGPRGCGASATSGAPLMAAVGLLATMLLGRRRRALAPARTRRP